MFTAEVMVMGYRHGCCYDHDGHRYGLGRHGRHGCCYESWSWVGPSQSSRPLLWSWWPWSWAGPSRLSHFGARSCSSRLWSWLRSQLGMLYVVFSLSRSLHLQSTDAHWRDRLHSLLKRNGESLW